MTFFFFYISICQKTCVKHDLHAGILIYLKKKKRSLIFKNNKMLSLIFMLNFNEIPLRQKFKQKFKQS